MNNKTNRTDYIAFWALGIIGIFILILTFASFYESVLNVIPAISVLYTISNALLIYSLKEERKVAIKCFFAVEAILIIIATIIFIIQKMI